MPHREELERQRELLATPLGEPGSGMVRYAAAMSLHLAGELAADVLEAYRICCKLDDDDPRAVAQMRRTSHRKTSA